MSLNMPGSLQSATPPPPAVSVVVPVYNVEKFLSECVDSILAQTFTDYEIILVDDGSPDGSGAICDAYAERESRISVIHKENGGVSTARNAGIDAARGEYIAFVDSDDTIPPTALADLYVEVENHPGVTVVVGQILASDHIIAPSLDVLDYTEDRAYIRSRNLWKMLSFSASSRLVRREDVIYHRLYFMPGISCGEDPLWVYMLHKHVKSVAQCRKVVYEYRHNEESVMNSKDLTKNYCSKLSTTLIAARAFDPTARRIEAQYLCDALSIGRLKSTWNRCDRVAVRRKISDFVRDLSATKIPLSVKLAARLLTLPYAVVTSRTVVILQAVLFKMAAR